MVLRQSLCTLEFEQQCLVKVNDEYIDVTSTLGLQKKVKLHFDVRGSILRVFGP
jgi:hypothetical protein